MESNNRFLRLELCLLFFVVPIALASPLPPLLLVAAALIAIAYVARLAWKERLLSKSTDAFISENNQWQSILLRFSVFAAVTGLLVWQFLPEKLFLVIRQNFLMWLGICFVYTFLSVIPQEFIYRQFFFHRYEKLLLPKLLIPVNAIAFCLAHTLFMNSLVFALTLAGGFLFARTFRKTRSLLITSVEHTLYGLWLFTIGLGEMLAFPTPS